MPDSANYIPAGEEWVGTLCVNPRCQLPMLFLRVTADMLQPDGSFVFRGEAPTLKCHHCGTEAVYPKERLQRFRTEERGKLS